MATAATKTSASSKKTEAPKNEIAKAASTAVSADLAMDFAADAGRGMEGASTESYAIPFLSVLQKSSPQVDEDSGVAIDGAKAGMFYNTATQELIEGREVGVTVVPCAYRRVFLRWGPRAANGGFKGEYTPEQVADMRAEGKIVEHDGRLFAPLEGGEVNPDKCDRFADVRNHYILILTEDGNAQQALMSLTSTQVKKSKGLMTMLSNIRLKNQEGRFYSPPAFANVIRVKSVPESNDKGSWSGVQFSHDGQVQSGEVYAKAKAFNQSVVKGSVTANYDEDSVAGSGGGRSAAGPAEGF